MKLHSTFVLAALASPLVTAFPSAEHILKLSHQSKHGAKRMFSERSHGQLLPRAANSPIDVSGSHAFQPPDFANGDQRGPCPGLNALANHGYIPRNGVVGMNQAVSAVNQVFGMGLDLGNILSTMGTVYVGDPYSLEPGYSIGGVTSDVGIILNNLLGLLGTPQGLDGSHNFIESDSSNTRDDLYVSGNNHRLNMTKFMQWYEMADSNGTFDMATMARRAKNRFDESVATNPQFYYGPYTGLIAHNAGYLFAAKLFRNYSSENPDGVLTKETVRSFFAISGEDGNLTYNEGWERIPDNWYPTPSDYMLTDFNVDLLYLVSQYPELASIGGNTGTVNSFAGIDVTNMTGGVYSSTTLLEGNNLVCFALEALKTASPNALSGLYVTITEPLNMVNNALGSPLANLACPALGSLTLGGQPWWNAALSQFPGAMRAGSAL